MSAYRRRLLLGQCGPVPSPQNWDLVWNYSQGNLSDSGWSTTTTGGMAAMQPDGLHLSVKKGSRGYIQYICPTAKAKHTLMEVDFSIISLAEYDIDFGFRLVLSNGNNQNLRGWQVFINSFGIWFSLQNPNGDDRAVLLTDASAIQSGTHTLRLEFNENSENGVWIDGNTLYKGNDFASQFTNANKILQQNSGETVIKELRYLFKEV